MKQGREAKDACRHMGHDTKGAAKGRPDAGFHAASQSKGKGINHAGAGQGDDDERCDQVIKGDHGASVCLTAKSSIYGRGAKHS